MRSGGNPLDLNNLPEEYGRDGKQIIEDNSNTEASDSTTRCRKKKSGKDECGKVYECRFCSLKFCKSQALGGHMNRHRQERETETLNRARQLVFSNDNNLAAAAAAAQGGPHLGLRDMNIAGTQAIPPGSSFHQNSNMGEPILPYRPAYNPTRLFSTSSSSSPMQPAAPTPPQAYLYTPSSSRLMSFPASSSHYPPQYPMNDYFVGHVLPPHNSHRQPPNVNYSNRGPESNYTCIGAPLGRDHQYQQPHENGGVTDLSASGASGEDSSMRSNNQEDGLSWGRSNNSTYAGTTTTQCFDPSSSINRFQDGL